MKTLIALVLCCLVASAAFADSEKKPDAATEAQMAEMMKYANPGPQHEKLKAMVGTWDATMSNFNPSMPGYFIVQIAVPLTLPNNIISTPSL